MTTHKDIQNPDNFNIKDYQKWEYLLFDDETSSEVLEDIVMTLAHLPTQQAQDLLDKFKHSENAHKVEWLEPAIDEGKLWLLSPTNEKEERDMKALKLYFKKENEIVELMGECNKHAYNIELMTIELEALNQLQQDKPDEAQVEDIKCRIIALNDLMKMEQNRLNEAKQEIAVLERINEKIKGSIKTERYKKLKAWDVDGFHFDGETG